MAGFSLLALLDDIGTVLDDVAVMAKVAARKTAGVLGDDLALTAQQVFGVRAKRELPVVLSVAKGSLLNKLILIPGALLISAFAPWLITPLLMIGGAYLCAEGGEKIHRHLIQRKKPHPAAMSQESEAMAPELATLTPPELEVLEKKKISGAIKTDFVLSTEIIVIALGSIPLATSLAIRAALLVVVGLLMTGGVYGFVAFIVKLDDIGYWLVKKYPTQILLRKLGNALVVAAPVLMKVLTLVGTLAMFMVGGGILAHGLPFVAHLGENWPIWPPLLSGLWGLLAGVILHPTFLGLEILAGKIKKTFQKN
ncbi:MAG: DUF808 domain-containing protein [Deltaproteobacteria bacterium]|nr:DUF808 domain-containing protein [Deltaproteobacteria bacterium]